MAEEKRDTIHLTLKDGVVVIPFDSIDSVIAKLGPLQKAEAGVEALVKSGMSEPDYIADLMTSNKTRYVT